MPPLVSGVLFAAAFALSSPSSSPLPQQPAKPPDAAAATGPAAQGRLAIGDYWQWENVADPRLSPDGRQVVFTRTWFDPIEDRPRNELWLMDADGARLRQLGA